MTVGELIELLRAYPDYWPVAAGHQMASEVRDVTQVVRGPVYQGGQATDARTIVVIE